MVLASQASTNVCVAFFHFVYLTGASHCPSPIPGPRHSCFLPSPLKSSLPGSALVALFLPDCQAIHLLPKELSSKWPCALLQTIRAVCIDPCLNKPAKVIKFQSLISVTSALVPVPEWLVSCPRLWLLGVRQHSSSAGWLCLGIQSSFHRAAAPLSSVRVWSMGSRQ